MRNFFITFSLNSAIIPGEPFSPFVIYLLNTWPEDGKQFVLPVGWSHVVNA